MTDKDRAADYVLGVLSAEERAQVERDAAADPALAAEIARWDREMSPLLLDAPEVEPPAYLFDRIKAAIATDAKPQGALAGSRTVRAGGGQMGAACPGHRAQDAVAFDRENGNA